MEDYIFLIIAVVISIVAAIKKNSKKTDDANPFVEKAERPRNFFMDQLLGADFLDEPKEEVKPMVRIKPVVKKEPVLSTIPIGQPGHYHPGFISTLPDRSKSKIQSSFKNQIVGESEKTPATGGTSSYLSDFSLRKAFVYSEIMARKYEL